MTASRVCYSTIYVYGPLGVRLILTTTVVSDKLCRLTWCHTMAYAHIADQVQLMTDIKVDHVSWDQGFRQPGTHTEPNRIIATFN